MIKKNTPIKEKSTSKKQTNNKHFVFWLDENEWKKFKILAKKEQAKHNAYIFNLMKRYMLKKGYSEDFLNGYKPPQKKKRTFRPLANAENEILFHQLQVIADIEHVQIKDLIAKFLEELK